jgi:hypothetical protein
LAFSECCVASEYQNVFQILDNVSKTAGNHALKFGVNFQHIRFSTLEPPVGSRGIRLFQSCRCALFGLD